MSQHDFDIANAAGATVRADINAALAALATLSSGATAPSTTYGGMLWLDTANARLKIRDAANANWVVVAGLSGTTWTPWAAGAAILTQSIATEEEAEAGSENTKRMTPLRVAQAIAALGATVKTGGLASLSSGTGAVITDFGGVAAPERISLAFDQVSLDGTDNLLVQLGTGGALVTSGYTPGAVATASSSGTFVTSANGFIINLGVAARAFSGRVELEHVASNVWVCSVSGMDTVAGITGGGRVALGGAIDRVGIGRTGSNNFDGGQVRLHAE